MLIGIWQGLMTVKLQKPYSRGQKLSHSSPFQTLKTSIADSNIDTLTLADLEFLPHIKAYCFPIFAGAPVVGDVEEGPGHRQCILWGGQPDRQWEGRQ